MRIHLCILFFFSFLPSAAVCTYIVLLSILEQQRSFDMDNKIMLNFIYCLRISCGQNSKKVLLSFIVKSKSERVALSPVEFVYMVHVYLWLIAFELFIFVFDLHLYKNLLYALTCTRRFKALEKDIYCFFWNVIT